MLKLTTREGCSVLINPSKVFAVVTGLQGQVTIVSDGDSWIGVKEPAVKWDGCSHVFFSGGDGVNRDGYLHLCGVKEWKSHVRVMEWAYREAAKLINAMESDEMWEEA